MFRLLINYMEYTVLVYRKDGLSEYAKCMALFLYYAEACCG